MPILTLAVLFLAAPFFEPLTPDKISAWQGERVAGHPALERLAAFLEARDLEGTGKREPAFATLDPLDRGKDPLAIAIRFHRERLALELGHEPGKDLWALFAGPASPRPTLRWGITREQEATALRSFARHLAGRGKVSEAAAIRRHVALEYPRWCEAPPELSRTGQRRRATNLIRDMDYEGGRQALMQLIAAAPAGEVLALKRQLGALIADKMRNDYPAAVGIFRDIVADPASRADDHLYLAYLLGKVDAAASVAAYRAFLERFAEHPERDEAAFFVVWDHFDQERFAEAITGFTAFIQEYPGSAFRHAAHWYRALCLYRIERWAEALSDLQHTEQTGRERDKGAYWTARVLQRLGRHPEAEARLIGLSRSAPLSYYGLLARSRLPVEKRPPLWLPAPKSLAAKAAAIQKAAAVAFAALPATRRDLLVEALAVTQVGEPDLARRLFRHAEKGGLDPTLRDFLRPIVGDYRRIIRSKPAKACYRAMRSNPADPPVGACWRWLYPLAYQPIIEAVRGPVPAEMFWAIMRQESLYDPEARSRADALGLLQLIPQVGGPAAAALDLPFAPYRLLQPRLNLTLFAQHARATLKRANGHLPLFLMAYNASPEMLDVWLGANAALPFDLFVEEISYKETRDYVKRVTSHLAHYRALTAPAAAIPVDQLLAGAGLPLPDTPAGEAFGLAH